MIKLIAEELYLYA